MSFTNLKKEDLKNFLWVHFVEDGSNDVLPSSWVTMWTISKKEIKWPPVGTKNIQRYVQERQDPEENWHSFEFIPLCQARKYLNLSSFLHCNLCTQRYNILQVAFKWFDSIMIQQPGWDTSSSSVYSQLLSGSQEVLTSNYFMHLVAVCSFIRTKSSIQTMLYHTIKFVEKLTSLQDGWYVYYSYS